MKRLMHECHQGLVLERFGEKWEVPPAYTVPCQILVDVAGHENYSQVFPYAERADGQLVAVNMGKLIGAGGQLKAWRGKDEVGEQQIDGPFVLCADFKGV